MVEGRGGNNTPKQGEQGFQKSTAGKDINVPKFSNSKKPYGNLEESAEEQKTYSDIVSPKKRHQIRAQIKARKIIEEQVKSQTTSLTLSFGSIEEQMELFNSWAKADSQVPDLYPPEKDYRYDVMEPILNPEHDDLEYDSARALRRLGYEHYYAKRLPVFVTGSKDLAKPRLACLSGSVREIDTQVFLEGVEITDNELPGAFNEIPLDSVGQCKTCDGEGWVSRGNDSTPLFSKIACSNCDGFGEILVPHEESSVTGALIWIKTDPIGSTSRQSLDALHGFNKNNPWDSKYTRTVRQVNNGKFTRPAWVYILNP